MRAALVASANKRTLDQAGFTSVAGARVARRSHQVGVPPETLMRLLAAAAAAAAVCLAHSLVRSLICSLVHCIFSSATTTRRSPVRSLARSPTIFAPHFASARCRRLVRSFFHRRRRCRRCRLSAATATSHCSRRVAECRRCCRRHLRQSPVGAAFSCSATATTTTTTTKTTI